MTLSPSIHFILWMTFLPQRSIDTSQRSTLAGPTEVHILHPPTLLSTILIIRSPLPSPPLVSIVAHWPLTLTPLVSLFQWWEEPPHCPLLEDKWCKVHLSPACTHTSIHTYTRTHTTVVLLPVLKCQPCQTDVLRRCQDGSDEYEVWNVAPPGLVLVPTRGRENLFFHPSVHPSVLAWRHWPSWWTILLNDELFCCCPDSDEELLMLLQPSKEIQVWQQHTKGQSFHEVIT